LHSAQTSQPVPMLDLKRQYRPLHQELLEAVDHVLETQQFILGEPVAAFERPRRGNWAWLMYRAAPRAPMPSGWRWPPLESAQAWP